MRLDVIVVVIFGHFMIHKNVKNSICFCDSFDGWVLSCDSSKEYRKRHGTPKNGLGL